MSLCVTGAVLDGERVGLRAEEGMIVALGPGVAAREGDEVIDADGGPLVEPLLNGHTHAAMTLFRGYGDDLPLMRWLEEKIWPVEAKLEADDVYWGTRLACVEMIRTGTTRFWDMYWQPQAAARAVRDAGLRAAIGTPLIDVSGSLAELREAARRGLEATGELAEPGRIVPSLAPHAIYSVSEASLRWIAELGAERDAPVQIHLSETEQEVDRCLAEHGVRPAVYLDGLGLLGPSTVLAHGVWLDRGELELIAERGATVVSNPVANQKLAVGGAFPYPLAREAGVMVALGTDGAGSNNSLDLLSDVKSFALIQKHAARDPAVIDAAEAWAIATGARAPRLGSGGRLGVGEAADFLLLRPGTYELGLGELRAGLVYAASGSVVDTTVVAGEVLMRGGVVPDAGEVLARARERARGLGLL
ncbi:MAG: amidohydrolase [Solirubrobacterales bacterium]